MPAFLKTSIVANYVRQHALFAMLGAALLLLLLQVSFAYLGELEDVKGSYGYVDALQHVLWQAPRYLYELLPMAALVGSVVGLGALASNSELTVLRAAGTSLFRMVGWVLQSAMVLCVLALLLNQYVLPVSNAKAKFIKKPDEMTRVGEMNGYWTRAKNQVVYVDYASESGNISGLTVWQLDDNARIRQLVSSASGVFLDTEKKWQLNQAQTMSLDAFGNATQVVHDKKIMSLPINPELIYLLTRPAEDLSVSQLYTYNQDMATQGRLSPEHRLVFWQKLLSPLSVISLVLVACSFIFGSLRQQSMGLRLVVALMVGLSFRYIQDLTGFMSLAFQAPPFWFVMVPILLCTLLGMMLLIRKR